jgi:hypothetical protein
MDCTLYFWDGMGIIFCNTGFPNNLINVRLFYHSRWLRLIKSRTHKCPDFIRIKYFSSALRHFCTASLLFWCSLYMKFHRCWISVVLEAQIDVCSYVKSATVWWLLKINGSKLVTCQWGKIHIVYIRHLYHLLPTSPLRQIKITLPFLRSVV